MSSTKDVLVNASKTDWTQTQDFTFIYIQNPNFTKFNIETFCWFEGTALDLFQKCTMSVDIPQSTASEMDTVLGGQRRVNIRLQELFRFNAKFKDYDSLSLRSYFKALWMATHSEYPNDIMGTVIITDADDSIVFHSTNVTINSVSAVQFDNNSNQIAEFDVQFLSPTYSDYSVKDFGTADYADVFVD